MLPSSMDVAEREQSVRVSWPMKVVWFHRCKQSHHDCGRRPKIRSIILSGEDVVPVEGGDLDAQGGGGVKDAGSPEWSRV